MTIKIGFIGLGRMGMTHLSILNSNASVNVTSVCEPSRLLCTLFRKYFRDVSVFSDYKDLLEKDKPDAVVISIPPAQHYKVVKDCIEKGIHVFIEKPFTLSYKDSSLLSQMAEETGVINQVGYVNRFNDVFVKAKEMIDHEVIGKITSYKSEMYTSVITHVVSNDGWRAKPESGGGCLTEVASHAIDLLNYLIGTPEKAFGSVFDKVFSKNVEDIVSSCLIYKEGLTGSMYVNWSEPSFRKASNKIEISGEKGSITVDQLDLNIYLEKNNKKYKLHSGMNNLFITDLFKNVPFYVRGNEFTNQLYHFIDCIQNRNHKNKSSFSDAAETHKVIKLIRDDYVNNLGSMYGKN